LSSRCATKLAVGGSGPIASVIAPTVRSDALERKSACRREERIVPIRLITNGIHDKASAVMQLHKVAIVVETKLGKIGAAGGTGTHRSEKFGVALVAQIGEKLNQTGAIACGGAVWGNNGILIRL
jgi:hypothetical protein